MYTCDLNSTTVMEILVQGFFLLYSAFLSCSHLSLPHLTLSLHSLECVVKLYFIFNNIEWIHLVTKKQTQGAILGSILILALFLSVLPFHASITVIVISES